MSEKKENKPQAKASNLEIALTVVGMSIGAIAGDAIIEYIKPDQYIALATGGGALAGAAIGQGVYYAQRAVKNYSQNKNL